MQHLNLDSDEMIQPITMIDNAHPRLAKASRAACLHLLLSLAVAAAAATLVFGVWYPFPYSELSSGRELFLLLVAVDVVCGPLLTLVLFNPAKPRRELWLDIGLVALIQLAALGYGLNVVKEARPLYLVQEIDRFKVISAPDIDMSALVLIPVALQPVLTNGPLTVAIREPRNAKEREQFLFESIQGGRDYAERPDFYLTYEGANALKALKRAKPLAVFLQRRPEQLAVARKLASEKNADITQWMYLPVVARQDWVAVLDRQGQIQGFLKGDGF